MDVRAISSQWRLRVASAAALILLAAPMPASALDAASERDEVKAAMVDKLLHPRPSPWMPDAGRMLALMADQPLRRLFASLGERVAWGPADRQWRVLFPQFRDEYLALLAPESAAVEKALATRLMQTMSDDEIAELVAVLADPELELLLQTASRLGLDLEIAVKTTHLAAAPELYSPDEIAEIRNELSKLQGRAPEMMALAARMQAISRRFASPAFVSYQRVMVDALLPLAAATVDDPAFRQRFDAWADGWRLRLKENTK